MPVGSHHSPPAQSAELTAGVAIVTAAIEANIIMTTATRWRTNVFTTGLPSGVCTIESGPAAQVKPQERFPRDIGPFDAQKKGCQLRGQHRGCSVTAVKFSRVFSSVALAVCVAATVLTFATSSTATAAGSCPTAAPQNAGTPEWTLAGTTGSVAVTGSTDTTAPRVNVTTPFSVAQTQVHTLQAGNGPVVSSIAKVSVCYMGVNGRDGSVFDSSYQRGEAVDFPLTGVVAGFQKAIAGQTVGSTVAVAMTAADGYPDGQPSAGIRPGDSLIFAIKVLSASS